jgi:methyltransferase (TIGR00027 family)
MHHEPAFRHLVSNDTAEATLRFLKEISPIRAALLERGLGRSWFRGALRALDRMMLPGLMLHHAVRKRFIEDETRRALGEKARQVVVLGAGLDTLALRLHREFPGVMFVELDHPATQGVKRRLVDAGDLDAGDNLFLLPADFTRERADEVLARCRGYDPKARTILIMEGVLMYLDAADVDATFASVRRCGGSGSCFMFTFMEIGHDGHPGFRRRAGLSDLWLALKGEPFRWGLRPERLPGFLTERGFRLQECPSPADLRRRYLSGAEGSVDVAEGERIVLAEWT